MGIELIMIKMMLGIIFVLGGITIIRFLAMIIKWIDSKTDTDLFFWAIISLTTIGFLYLCFYIGGFILQWFLQWFLK